MSVMTQSVQDQNGHFGPSEAWAVAATVTDPELPMVTLAALGVLRDARVEADGTVVVEITPTYTGCPAMGVMRADLVHALHRAGFDDVDVRTVLSPAWTTDWITEAGRRKLAEAGIAPPGPNTTAMIELLEPARCPHCGSRSTTLESPFGPTPCRAIAYCRACKQPFEQFKSL